MAITLSYVDPIAGNDAGGLGTIGSPWKTLQWAFDHLVRNAADGNQVCLKSSGPHVNAATLDLTTFIAGGALSATAPLIVRGYTSAANDGGVGEIDCNGATMWVATTYDYVFHVDLEVHNFGNNVGIQGDVGCVLFRCEVHKGASTPTNKILVNFGNAAVLVGNYIHDTGTSNTHGGVCATGGYAHGNYIACGSGHSGTAFYAGYDTPAIGNIILCANAAAMGIFVRRGWSIGNAVYNTAAGTSSGIGHGSENNTSHGSINNIVCGWIGVGGEGIGYVNLGVIGHNAFWNNTATYTTTDQAFVDLTANDVTLLADPFTSAATGDFSLTVAAQAALRSFGWPAQYLGAHVNTDGHITIGPIQYGEASVGGVTRGRILYGVP